MEVYQDKALNVIIKKPGTKGYENSPVVILQGHMDMVPEKTTDSPHDFLKDPIKFVLKGDMLYADNTTLGGDDGIAVAYCLALLDSDDLAHPPLEVLITTEEETGMYGAIALTNEHLAGKRLVNIDSEEEGVFLVSCAGGANANASFKIKTEALKGELISIDISGLLGGHSGMEINKQRANAIKLLSRILAAAKRNHKLNIVEISGGSKDNAIAKNSHAIIASEDGSVLKTITEVAESLKAEYKTADKDIAIKIEKTSSAKKEMFTSTMTNNLIDLLMVVPDGVQYQSMDIEGLVQTSLNNGILEEKDGEVKLIISARSSIKSAMDELLEKIRIQAERCLAEFFIDAEYPAWEYSKDSPLRDIAAETYKKVYGKDPEITAIHAGLECGILKEVLPGIDAISFGPNLHDVHTPDEHMDIPSVVRIWKFLLAYLEALKN